MLGKLLKYELRSTSRMFLILYPAIILLALVNRLFFTVLSNSHILDIPRALSMFVYVCLVVAVFVVTILVMLQRFNRNLLGEEGYLMFTLPVSSHSLILSKLIVSLIWFIGSTIVMFISIFIIANTSYLSDLVNEYRQVSEMFTNATGAKLGGFLAIVLLCSIISLIMFILLVYLSISVGQLFNKNRAAASFGAFIGISFVVQALMMVAIQLLDNTNMINRMIGIGENMDNTEMYKIIMTVMLLCTGVVVLLGALYYFATNKILSKRLNIE